MRLRFRPHHLMCTLGFRGRGYSPEFVQNYVKIVKDLESDPEIEIVGMTDGICSPCPHRIGTTCAKEREIQDLDKSHGDALAVLPGDRMKWSEAKDRIRARVSLAKFHQMCSQCSWKKLGFCESALRELGVK